MGFEENRGQAARDVKFVSHGSGYALSLAPQEIDIALLRRRAMTASPLHRAAALRALREARKAMKTTVIRMQLEGANPSPAIAAEEPLPGKSNYFIGNNREKWVTDVPSYGRVKYSGIYPGVDVEFYGNQRHLEYDFTVAPGADPKVHRAENRGSAKARDQFTWRLDPSHCRRRCEIPETGRLPNGRRRTPRSGWKLRSRFAAIASRSQMAKYDQSLPL